jgi:hypothetical protein
MRRLRFISVSLIAAGLLVGPAVQPASAQTDAQALRAAIDQHNHRLPWTDRPLVINNLVGGEEGLADAGLSVARLVPNPWLFLEATGEVFRGDSGTDESPLVRSSRPSFKISPR